MRLIDADVLWKDTTTNIDDCGEFLEIIERQPTVTERTETLLDDGTLILECDSDISKVTRVNVRQRGTHFGDLFYPDEEERTGHWIERTTFDKDDTCVCSVCRTGEVGIDPELYNFCPFCGARMIEGE